MRKVGREPDEPEKPEEPGEAPGKSGLGGESGSEPDRERDRVRPRARTGAPGSRRPFNYMVPVGIVFALVVLIAVANMLRTTESGTVGIGDVGIGEKVAPFAVPLATSDLQGDANVNPDEACAVPGEDVLRICDFFDRPTVISFWFAVGGSGCLDEQDTFDRVMRGFRGRVNAVSINVRDDRDRLKELIAEHGWRVPVGHDRDGAVSNIYRVGGCPTFLFLEPGGILEETEIGDTSAEELTSQVRSLLNGQGEEEKTPAS